MGLRRKGKEVEGQSQFFIDIYNRDMKKLKGKSKEEIR